VTLAQELLADSERVRKALASLKIPEWKPKASKKIETDESVKKADVEKEEPVEQGAEVSPSGKLALETPPSLLDADRMS
jgi:hypothetical protein